MPSEAPPFGRSPNGTTNVITAPPGRVGLTHGGTNLSSSMNAPDSVKLVETFDAYYRRDYRRLLGLAYMLSRSDSASEDLVQDALTEAHRKWATVGRYDDPGSWVRRVMINKSTSRFRRIRTETRGLIRLAGQTQHSIDPSEPNAEVWEAVRALPTRQAQCVALHYWEDHSLNKIAEILQCSTETVKTHLARGRKALASTLATHEGGASL